VHKLAVASAQVKSALLLAGLWAEGETTVWEPGRSRDHTERMLLDLGTTLTVGANTEICVKPLQKPWKKAHFHVAPDISSAAFLLGAAVVTQSHELEVETAVNPTRSGFLDALAAFGLDIERTPLPDRGGEPMARLRLCPGMLRPAHISGELTLRAIDEIPLIAGLAAFIPGTTKIRDAGELRVKESDRIETTVALLRKFGAKVDEYEDGLDIHGQVGHLKPTTINAGHDHRIGLTAAVMGLGIDGETTVEGAQIVDVSYPGFARTIESFGGVITLG
jgi:3-phosphoshikimate 1-carboxyvinyltransferase